MGWKLCIDKSGEIRGVYDDSLLPLIGEGRALVKRASHVEPAVDDNGLPCWYADLSPVGGPSKMGPYYTRKEALEREVDWLREYYL